MKLAWMSPDILGDQTCLRLAVTPSVEVRRSTSGGRRSKLTILYPTPGFRAADEEVPPVIKSRRCRVTRAILCEGLMARLRGT